jgi:hypothetical protein
MTTETLPMIHMRITLQAIVFVKRPVTPEHTSPRQSSSADKPGLRRSGIEPVIKIRKPMII